MSSLRRTPPLNSSLARLNTNAAGNAANTTNATNANVAANRINATNAANVGNAGVNRGNVVAANNGQVPFHNFRNMEARNDTCPAGTKSFWKSEIFMLLVLIALFGLGWAFIHMWRKRESSSSSSSSSTSAAGANNVQPVHGPGVANATNPIPYQANPFYNAANVNAVKVATNAKDAYAFIPTSAVADDVYVPNFVGAFNQ